LKEKPCPTGWLGTSDIVITDARCGIAETDDGDKPLVNKQKAVKREITRLRKVQNPQQADLKRTHKLRKAKTEFWAKKKRAVVTPVEAPEEKETRRKPEKAKEPELEEIQEETEEVTEEDESEES
jgi:hypothetical protein